MYTDMATKAYFTNIDQNLPICKEEGVSIGEEATLTSIADVYWAAVEEASQI
jgi:hypothetical protein